MADLKHLKVKPHYDLKDSDPLAELTRIMGLPPQADQDDDDFGIDLERELLGEFGGGDAAESLETSAPAPVADRHRVVQDTAPAGEPDGDKNLAARASEAEEFSATPEPVRPSLRIVAPVAVKSAERDAGAELRREADEPLADAGADQQGQFADMADDDYADPFGQLEAFSKDWFARRQGGAVSPVSGNAPVAPEPHEAVAGNDREDEGLLRDEEPADPEPMQSATTDYLEPRGEEEASAQDSVREHEESSNEAAPQAGEASSWDMWASEQSVGHQETKSDEIVFDPFAELLAMGSRPSHDVSPPHEDSPEHGFVSEAAAAEALAQDAGAEPETFAASFDETSDIQGLSDLDFDLDVSFEEAPVAEPANVAASDYEMAQPAEPPAPSEPQDPRPYWETPPASGDRRQESAAEVPVGDASAVALDEDFDLGLMLEHELAAEAAQIAGRGRAPASSHAASAAAPVAAQSTAWARDHEEPEVDTVEVPVSGVDVADDLDLPEFAFEDEQPAPAETDELDLDFASAFEELGQPQYRKGADAPATPYQPREAARQEPDRWSGTDAGGAYPAAAAAADQNFEELAGSWGRTEGQDGFAAPETYPAAEWTDDLYDHGAQDVVASAFYEDSREAAGDAAPSRRRGLIIAAVVAGVAVIGGLGALAFTLGDGGDAGEPTLVTVDPSPIKVRPEKPGGTIIPNEDKAVYDRVASDGKSDAPAQEKLVSTREEPIDLAARMEPASGVQAFDGVRGKSEDRLEQEIEQAIASPADEIPAVAPRRVRTMVVKPDGTLVPREEPAASEQQPQAVAAAPEAAVQESAAAVRETIPVAAAEQSAETAAAGNDASADEDAGAAEVSETPAEVAPAEPVEAAPLRTATETAPAAADSAPSQPAPTGTEIAAAETAPVRVVESRSFTPDRGPVAPARPSDQPVEIVGSAGGNTQGSTQVAATQPAAIPTAPASEWSMQIASQPSPEGAQKSYVNLAQRYGSILGGRGVNIVKADIAGKGTFWRVRIPAESKAEAVQLCERYKTAGGSCFVAK